MKNIGFTHIGRKMSRIRIARFLRKVIRFFLRYKESYTFYLHCSTPTVRNLTIQEFFFLCVTCEKEVVGQRKMEGHKQSHKKKVVISAG